jgi:hypothetical protein
MWQRSSGNQGAKKQIAIVSFFRQMTWEIIVYKKFVKNKNN